MEAFSSPWCSPAVLIERLSVLAEYPYSADWARETIAEVRALTEAERPSTAVVASQLERLTSLTAEALALAN